MNNAPVKLIATEAISSVTGESTTASNTKPAVLRTAGFVLLAVVDSPVTLLIASVAIGFAGALFNPAVRAYLAA